MNKKYSTLLFIDELNFKQLQSKSTSLQDIFNLILNTNFFIEDNACENKNKVSYLTFSQIQLFNLFLNKCLFDTSFIFKEYKGSNVFLLHQDVEYIKHYVKTYLKEESDSCDLAVCCDPSANVNLEVEKYYEIISLPDSINNNLLVVFKEKFFTNLTKSKNDFLKFVLDCLSQQYKSDTYMESLLKLYLSVKNIEGYLDLIKLRSE